MEVRKVVEPLCHGFKNRTGPVSSIGSTGNRTLIRSGYYLKREMKEKPDK